MTERIAVCNGWSVEHDAPTLRILEGSTVVFESHEWNPNMADPREDALIWASAVADSGSGLTVEDDDNPEFAAGVNYVRAHAPAHFADECQLLARDGEDESA